MLSCPLMVKRTSVVRGKTSTFSLQVLESSERYVARTFSIFVSSFLTVNCICVGLFKTHIHCCFARLTYSSAGHAGKSA